MGQVPPYERYEKASRWYEGSQKRVLEPYAPSSTSRTVRASASRVNGFWR